VKNQNFVALTVMIATGLLFAEMTPAGAQGMISAPSAEGDIAEIELEGLGKTDAQVISTIQRLLRRLGYLKNENMTRKLDAATTSALINHLQTVKISTKGLTGDTILQSLFSSVWIKEGWATGSVNGQDLVVDKPDVLSAQDALKKLGYAPGPVDGVFGPATLSAIEIFQEDNGMKITGLLTRNILQNLTRAVKFVGQTPASVVRVLNWPDYINPEVLENFEKETKIRVLHDVFDNSAETKELLQQGSAQYDVMVQTGDQLRQIIETANAVEPLDPARLPNAQYLDPAALNYTGGLDPGNAHSVPYLWGTVGIGVNKEKLAKIAPNVKLDSLSLILDPAIAAEVSKCGIAIVDEPNDMIPALVAYVGGDIHNIGITDLETVWEALSAVSSYVKIVSVESYIDSFAEGKYCVVLGYSGDIFLARDTAAENKTGTIVYSVPKEGSLLWFDLLVIPGAAKNKEAAYQFLNYLMKPEVAAANTNFIQYANPISASAPFIDKELLNDPALYPPKSVLKRLAVQAPTDMIAENQIKRIWAKLTRE
jgi:putrescine transport system substrate-binding protein